MADTTSSEAEVSRDEAADLLEDLAGELRGEGQANVDIGNKTVELSPPSNLTYEIDTEERSPMLGGRRETVSITLGWEAEEE